MVLGDMLSDTPFEINVFTRYKKDLTNGEDISSEKTSEIMKDDLLNRVPERGRSAKNDDHRTLYVNDVTEVLYKQVGFCRIEEILVS